MSITRSEVILDISQDLSSNPLNYDESVISQLRELIKYIASNPDVSGYQCKIMYDNLVKNTSIRSTDYWSQNYINKTIYKSLKKFQNKKISNADLLLMITSIISRSIIASRDTEIELSLFRVDEFGVILTDLLSRDVNSEYPTSIIDRLDSLCKSLQLYPKEKISDDDN